MNQVKVDLKVKMTKIIHKDTFVVRYFFLELLENNIIEKCS